MSENIGEKIPYIILAEASDGETNHKAINWFYGSKDDALAYCKEVKSKENINKVILCQMSRWIDFE